MKKLYLLPVFIFSIIFSSCVKTQEYPAMITKGQEFARIFNFKDGFTAKHKDGYALCTDFELRKTKKNDKEFVFIRGRQYVEGAVFEQNEKGEIFVSKPIKYDYSDQIYSISLDHDFNLTSVTSKEWDLAQNLPDFGTGTEKTYPPQENNIEDQKNNTSSTKPVNLHTLWSQNKTSNAKFSHISKKRWYKKPSIIPFLGGDDQIGFGKHFVHIFKNKNSTPLVTVEQNHNESWGYYFFEQSRWIGDHVFIMPTSNLLQSWLIVVL